MSLLKKVAFVFILIILLNDRIAYLKFLNETSSCTVNTKYKLMSSKTAYEEILEFKNKEFKVNGCEPIGLWHLSRHGARYPDADDIVLMNEKLPKLRDIILSSKKNEWLCDNDIRLLRKWKPIMMPENDNILTENGKRQMKKMAKRIQERFYSLVNKIKSPSQVNVITTNITRTIQSAEEYLNGMFNKFSKKIQINSASKDVDYMLKFPDLCERFIKEIDKNKNACPESNEFESLSSIYQEALINFHLRTNTTEFRNDSKIFDMALKACQYEFLIDGRNSIWCKFFDKKILKILEYREDIKYHCKYGYKYSISSLMTCDLVKNLIENLESFKLNTQMINQSNKKSVLINLLFAHSSTVLPFYSTIGVGKSEANFDFKNITIENVNRNYRISVIDPMNSNIAFAVYKCKSDKRKHVLKVFQNEKAIKPQGCGRDSTECDLEKFIQFYSQFIDLCGSTKQVCNV